MHVSELYDEITKLIASQPELEPVLASVKEKAKLARDESLFVLKIRDKCLSMLEEANDIISLLDRDGKLLYVNKRWKAQLGDEPKEVLGTQIFRRFNAAEDMEAPLKILEGIFDRKEHHFGIENLVRKKDGSYRWHITNLSPILDKEGEVMYAMGISRDNHLHKLNEMNIAEKEYRMRIILDNMQEGVIQVDNNDVIQYVNNGVCKIFGYTKEELIGKTGYELLMTEESARTILDKNLERLKGISSQYEVQGKTKSGELIWLGASGTPLRGEDDTIIGSLAILSNITERYRFIKALRESEELFRSLFEGSVAGIFQGSLDGHLDSANPAFAKIFGYESAEEAVAAKLTAEDVFVHHSDTQQIKERLLAGEIVKNHEVQMRRKDGRFIWVNLNMRLIQDDTKQNIIQATCVDISEGKSLREQLIASQNMELVGKLSAEIAHSFNDLLTVILGYSEDLLELLNPNMPLYEPAEEILKAGMRAAELTRQLLSMSSQQSAELKELNINNMLNNYYRIVSHFAGPKVKLEYQLLEGLPFVLVDARQMEQVLVNMIINARDAMPEGGEIYVRSSVNQISETDDSSGLKPGRYVTLSITDTGRGMDEDTKKYLFEPFFTTKKDITGLGLGLSSAYKFIQDSGGTISCQSEPGKGSTMRIWLPVYESRDASARSPINNHDNRGKGQRILVVDDEEAIGRMVQKTLNSFGY